MSYPLFYYLSRFNGHSMIIACKRAGFEVGGTGGGDDVVGRYKEII